MAAEKQWPCSAAHFCNSSYFLTNCKCFFVVLKDARLLLMGRNTVILCVNRCKLCLRAASLRLRFERKKKNAKDRTWRRNRDKPPSSSCNPPSAHDPPQGTDENS